MKRWLIIFSSVMFATIFAMNRPVIAQESAPAAAGQAHHDAAAYNTCGHIGEMDGDYERAIADYSRAVELAPDNLKYRGDLATAYAYRGQAHLIRGNHEQGLADLRRYVRLASDNASPEVRDLIALMAPPSRYTRR